MSQFEIAVTFDPSVTDWLMVWVTLGSIVVSAVLAVLAYTNGRKATKIAGDTTKRDAQYREEELARREQEERKSVGLAMLRALVASERFAVSDGAKWQTTVAERETEMDRRRLEALARIDMYASPGEDDSLHRWFSKVISDVAKREDGDAVQRVLLPTVAAQVRSGIVLWTRREITSDDLSNGKYPEVDLVL